MNIFHAIILSMVEGITEFLPVSSTGHLVVASELLGIAPTHFTTSFTIFIQLGAILAVTALYRKTLARARAVWLRVAAAFVPTAVVGLLLFQFILS